MLTGVTRSIRSIVIILPAAVVLSGCATAGPTATPAVSTAPPAAPSEPAHGKAADSSPADSSPADPGQADSRPAGSGRAGSRPAGKHTTEPPTRPAPAGPRIVSFRIAQRPKCAEGTAVFRAPAVPLIIEWKIAGATRGALSVDDPTHTPGTYGPVALEGTLDFEFSCAGDVGTSETHTYALYTVGGGATRSATLTASAKVLDKGK